MSFTHNVRDMQIHTFVRIVKIQFTSPSELNFDKFIHKYEFAYITPIMHDPLALIVCKADILNQPKIAVLEISFMDLLDVISKHCQVNPFNIPPFNFCW